MHAIMAANVLNGVDRDCRAWIRKFREPAPAAAPGSEAAAGGDDADARRRARDECRRRRG
jgi:5-methyltetrahydrofolate--homocysteine methyltransferase